METRVALRKNPLIFTATTTAPLPTYGPVSDSDRPRRVVQPEACDIPPPLEGVQREKTDTYTSACERDADDGPLTRIVAAMETRPWKSYGAHAEPTPGGAPGTRQAHTRPWPLLFAQQQGHLPLPHAPHLTSVPAALLLCALLPRRPPLVPTPPPPRRTPPPPSHHPHTHHRPCTTPVCCCSLPLRPLDSCRQNDSNNPRALCCARGTAGNH